MPTALSLTSESVLQQKELEGSLRIKYIDLGKIRIRLQKIGHKKQLNRSRFLFVYREDNSNKSGR